jgi:hypothetical protein
LERRWKIPRWWGIHRERFGLCDSYLGPDSSNGQMEERIEDGAMIHASLIAIWDDGSAHFVDGRHTFCAMRDSGYTHASVIIRDEDSFQNVKSTGLHWEVIQQAVQPWNYKGTSRNGVPPERVH